MKIIQIEGFKGLINAAFIGICLFAGFVVFPGLVAMHLWNKYLAAGYMFPVLNTVQGVLLWGIVAISYCILTKNKMAISFKEAPQLTDSDLDMILNKAKQHSQIKKLNDLINNNDTFEKTQKTSANESNLTVSSPFSIKNDITSEKEEEKVTDIK